MKKMIIAFVALATIILASCGNPMGPTTDEETPVVDFNHDSMLIGTWEHDTGLGIESYTFNANGTAEWTPAGSSTEISDWSTENEMLTFNGYDPIEYSVSSTELNLLGAEGWIVYSKKF